MTFLVAQMLDAEHVVGQLGRQIAAKALVLVWRITLVTPWRLAWFVMTMGI
jgi:hypothetical protein